VVSVIPELSQAAIDLAGYVGNTWRSWVGWHITLRMPYWVKKATLCQTSPSSKKTPMTNRSHRWWSTGYRPNTPGRVNRMSHHLVGRRWDLCFKSAFGANSEFLLKEHVGETDESRRNRQFNAHGQTSDNQVCLPTGDVTTTPYKQIIISMGGWCNAALGAFDYLIRKLNRLRKHVRRSP